MVRFDGNTSDNVICEGRSTFFVALNDCSSHNKNEDNGGSVISNADDSDDVSVVAASIAIGAKITEEKLNEKPDPQTALLWGGNVLTYWTKFWIPVIGSGGGSDFSNPGDNFGWFRNALPVAATTRWYVKQPTWRLWGEERTDGAIYTVYLKKVRYHRPTRALAANSDSEDDISHLEWETVRVRFVKAATLTKLVEALSTDDGELETTYINVFLATYRSFSTCREVLQLLLDRYEAICNGRLKLGGTKDTKAAVKSSSEGKLQQQHEQHKKTIIAALHVWLDSYPEDFNDPPYHTAMCQLLSFCQQYAQSSELEAKVRQRFDAMKHPEGASICTVEEFGNSCCNGGSDVLWTSSSSPLPKGKSCDEHGDLILAPSVHFALRTNVPTNWRSYKLPDVPVRHFAEQLTRLDVELFRKLVPHQCLGAVWSRRDKSRSHEAATVLATVNQFNAVSFRVISSILMESPSLLRNADRAQIIACWIDIAQELRLMKNFSSLRAIISGLQSNPIYRLHRTWQCMSKEKQQLFNELANIFSDDNNQLTQRELLMREGTAKYADTVGEHDRQLQKVMQRQHHQSNIGSISFGTIPYLGTFLTDLTMIDTAIPDTIVDEVLGTLINFDKRRKEFEVLAQIKLLQGAANAYHFERDVWFERWFDSILVLDDRESYQLSCQIETPAVGKGYILHKNNTTPNTSSNNKSSGAVGGGGSSGGVVGGAQQSAHDSIASTSSSNSGTVGDCSILDNTSDSFSVDRMPHSPSQMSRRSTDSAGSATAVSMDASINSSNSSSVNVSQISVTSNGVRILSSNGTASTWSSKGSNGSSTVGGEKPAIAMPQPSDFYIIKVTYETDVAETDGVVVYKSIMLGNSERTPQVIRNAMYKLGVEGNPDDFSIAQVLPNKEMVLPPNANVYYAINAAYNLNFILRSKRPQLHHHYQTTNKK